MKSPRKKPRGAASDYASAEAFLRALVTAKCGRRMERMQAELVDARGRIAAHDRAVAIFRRNATAAKTALDWATASAAQWKLRAQEAEAGLERYTTDLAEGRLRYVV